MLPSKHFALLFVSFVAGCGGSSSTGLEAVEPISAAGFAQDGGGFGGSYDLEVKGVTRTLGTANTLRQEIGSPIRIVGTSGIGPVRLEVNGRTFILQRSTENSSTLEYRDGNDLIVFQSPFAGTEFASATELFMLINGTLNSAMFVTGFDTDPAEVARITGSADYDGRISAALRNGFTDAFGRGDFRLTANFDQGTISGKGLLEDYKNDGAEFEFAPISLEFKQASISQNGFKGTLTATATDIDGPLIDGEYKGLFFGPDAASAGGQFNGQIDVPNSDTNTLIDGVFLGAK